MKIEVLDIGPEGLSVEWALTQPWLADALEATGIFVPAGEGVARLQLSRSETTVLAHGQAQMPLRAPCSRCLTATERRVVVPITATLVPETEGPQANEDGELTADEVSVSTYADDMIDLEALLHDELLLEMPMQALCRDACAGLCTQCGANKNETDCACADVVDEGPLGALAHITLRPHPAKKD